MNKVKNDHTPRQSLRRRFLIGLAIMFYALIGLFIVLIAAAVTILTLTRSGEFVAEMPIELVPKAEYLLAHPISTPSYLVIPPPSDWENTTKTRICVLTNENKAVLFARLFVNGSRLPSNVVSAQPVWVEEGEDYFGLGNDVTSICSILPLKDGLHLIEFQPSVLAAYPLYQWAIEVE
jgi:hypothetical protein